MNKLNPVISYFFMQDKIFNMENVNFNKGTVMMQLMQLLVLISH